MLSERVFLRSMKLVPYVIFSQGSKITINPGDTTTFTSVLSGVGSPNLAANSLKVGAVIVYRFAGVYSTSGSPTFSLRIHILNNFTTITPPVVSGAFDANWYCDFVGNVTAVGASGSLYGVFTSVMDGVNDAGAHFNPITIDTTADSSVDLSGQWGVSSSSNSFSVLSGFIGLYNN